MNQPDWTDEAWRDEVGRLALADWIEEGGGNGSLWRSSGLSAAMSLMEYMEDEGPTGFGEPYGDRGEPLLGSLGGGIGYGDAQGWGRGLGPCGGNEENYIHDRMIRRAGEWS